MRVTIEASRLEHVHNISCIEAQVYGTMAWSQQAFIDIFAQPNYLFYVALIEGEVVGYFVAQCADVEAELHNITVAPRWQKKGLGREMMVFLSEKLAATEIENIFLMVRTSNEAAKKLYAEFKFQKMTERKNYYRDPLEDAWILKVSLKKKV